MEMNVKMYVAEAIAKIEKTDGKKRIVSECRLFVRQKDAEEWCDKVFEDPTTVWDAWCKPTIHSVKVYEMIPEVA